MAAHEALYRKYRPQTFEDLAGQDPIARTLQNEVKEGRLAHAYLFTGPRGTGKTTTARLMAKALNCKEGKPGDPCGKCPQCSAIQTHSHFDVIEIDAASNRGIDDIRSLQERVQLAPVQGSFKVFIIDEVHMLTEPAWNALLKTLEEPPPRCVFIMATTEVHKVLATVLSRCQRFDFQRIALGALKERLTEVALAEAIAISPEAIDAIARRADGGLRDALSLLDQVSATTRDVALETVFEALGMVPTEEILTIGGTIAKRNVVGALEAVYRLLAAGHDHRTILRELLSWARNLLLLQLAPDRAEALEIPPAHVAGLVAQATGFTQSELLYAIEVLRETDGALRGSNQMTIWLEVGMLRLCERSAVPSLLDLSKRVEALEARLAGGVPVAGPVPAPIAAPPSARPPVVPVSAAVPIVTAPVPFPQATALEGSGVGARAHIREDNQIHGEGGAFEAAQRADAARAQPPALPPTSTAPPLSGNQDVLSILQGALDADSRSNAERFRGAVVMANRGPSGIVTITTKKSKNKTDFKHYEEGTEPRKYLLGRIHHLFGAETRVEIKEDDGQPRSLGAATAPAAISPAPGLSSHSNPLASPMPISDPSPTLTPGPSPSPQPAPIANGTSGAPLEPQHIQPPRVQVDSTDAVALATDLLKGRVIEGG